MRISDWSSDVCSSDLYVPRIPRVAPTAKAVHRPVDAPVRGGEQPAALHAAFQVGVDNPLDLGFGTLVHHAPARAAVLAAVDALFRHHRIDGIGHGAVGREGDDVTARQPPVDVAPALAGIDALQHTEPGTRHVALALFAGRDGR